MLSWHYAGVPPNANPFFPGDILRRWLAPEYRRPLVVQELLGYNADVLCLQEVDASMFFLCLRPHLAAAGALSRTALHCHHRLGPL